MTPNLPALVCGVLFTLLGALPAVGADPIVARLGSQDPPTTAKHRGLVKAAALIKERTKGEIDFQVFPSSQLGGAREMVEGAQLGTIDAVIVPASFIGGFNPAVSIFDVPYIFPTDREKSRKLREGPVGTAVLESFRKRGLEPVTLWSGGRKQFTSNKSLNDLTAFSGQRFRVMDSKILITQFSALGASAIVLPFGELYTALQNGVVDAQENPLDIIQAMKFFEVQKNLLVTDHGAIVEVILLSPKFYQRLSPAQRDIVKAAFREVAPEVEAGKEADAAKSLEFFKSTGLNVRIATEPEREKLRAVIYPKARDAYIAQAGAEGKALIDLYETELRALNK